MLRTVEVRFYSDVVALGQRFEADEAQKRKPEKRNAHNSGPFSANANEVNSRLDAALGPTKSV